MKRLLLVGFILLSFVQITAAQEAKNINEILSDKLCDRLCAAAREKSKELGIDISFAIADRHGLPRVYRRYGDAWY